MLLDRLESGFLLIETQERLVRVDPSFKERIYLLWTFRNFRQLSIPLLNPRQQTLVNTLFRKNVGVASPSYERSLVIGVVEKYVPLAVIEDSPALQHLPAVKEGEEEERQEEVIAQPEIVPQPNPVLVPSPSRAGFAWSRLATTVGALSLCVISVFAWHRVGVIPTSQAHDQPRLQQINAIALPNSSPSREPVTAVESPIVVKSTSENTTAESLSESGTVIASTPSDAQPIVVSNATSKSASETTPGNAVKPAAIAAVIPAPATPVVASPAPNPKPAIRARSATSTRNPPPSGQASIQASRPPLRFAYPDYPDVRARGVVCLTAAVDSDGVVRAVRVVSGNRALAAAAVRAVRQWRYRPYLKDGQPIATETNIVISFISDDAISMTYPPSIPGIH